MKAFLLIIFEAFELTGLPSITSSNLILSSFKIKCPIAFINYKALFSFHKPLSEIAFNYLGL